MRKLIPATMILLLLLSAHTMGASSTQLTKVSNQIQTLKKTLQQTYQQRSSLEQQLKTAEITSGKLSDQLNKLNTELKQEQKILAELKNTQQKTLTKLKIQNDGLTQQLRAAYQLGDMPQWKIILNQQDPNTTSRYLIYYRYLSQSRLTLIKEIKQSLTTLTQTIQTSKIHQQNLQRLVEKKRQQQNQEQRVLATRQKLITALNQQARGKQQQLQMLLANQKTLQETITRLAAQKISLNNQSFNQLRGKLAWPTQGAIMAGFGSNLDVGSQRLTGVIMKTEPGTPVHAVYSGKIIFANWLRGFGLLVIINHGNNYMSLYGRNRAIYAKVGDYVNTGDTIATTGNSGGYNQSSLYFEIRQNGTPINPSLWCRAKA